MPLPEGFSAWEHLQDTWRHVHNRRVREHFSDLDPEDLDINSPRGALKVACTLDDGDTSDMTILRSFLFWVVLGEAAALQTPVYGVPITGFQEARKFKPQIQLYFQEDNQDVEHGYAPVTAEISFRLMNEREDTITESDARTYANRIETQFGSAGGWTWRKGKLLCAYTDRTRGYSLQILAYNEAEARQVIERVLDIQNHTPDWKYLNVKANQNPTERYPTIPPTERIYGQQRRTPRQRPVATVRFKYASLHVWGLPNPVTLVDLTGTRRDTVNSNIA